MRSQRLILVVRFLFISLALMLGCSFSFSAHADDQGQAYEKCVDSGNYEVSHSSAGHQFKCVDTSSSYRCSFSGPRTGGGWASCITKGSYFPYSSGCSSRPALENEIKSPSPNGTGNVCHEGCTYSVSAGSSSSVLTYYADPTGDVCQANDDTPGGVSAGGGDTGGGDTGGGDTGGGDTGGGDTGGGDTGGGDTGGGDTGGGDTGGGDTGGGDTGGGDSGGGDGTGDGTGSGSDGLLSQIAGLLTQIKDALTGEGEAPDVGPEGDASEVWQSDDAQDFTPDESGYGGSCPAPPSVTVFGQVITFDNAPVCMWLRLGGWIVLALAALACLRIIATKEA